jgi:hypothetical protein
LDDLKGEFYMKIDYALRVLKDRRTVLQDRIFEIEDGQLNHHGEYSLEQYKSQLKDWITEVQNGIDVLEKRDS